MNTSGTKRDAYRAGLRAVGRAPDSEKDVPEMAVKSFDAPATPPNPMPQIHPAFDCCNDPPVEGGFYRRVQFLQDRHGEVFAVVFERSAKSEAVPQEMRQVTTKANAIATVIRRRLADHGDKQMWLHLLCVSSRLGTVGANADPEAALENLTSLEEMLVQAARPVRQSYIEALFLVFAAVAVVSFALFTFIDYAVSAHLCTGDITKAVSCDDLLRYLAMQAATMIGIALGVFFSGIVQNRVISLHSLLHFDPDGFSTRERHIYVWVVATAAQALILFKVLTFGVAGENFAELLTKPLLGILFGFIVAVSTEAVVTMVSKAGTPKEK